MIQDEIRASQEEISKLPKVFFDNLPYWVAALIVAIISSTYMKLFTLAEEWATTHVNSSNLMMFVLPPLGLILSVSICYFFAKEAGGTGIPQVIAASELAAEKNNYIDKLLGLKTLIVKPISSIVCVLFGGVAGREGPTIQLSGSVFYLVSKYWPKKISNPSFSSMIIAGGAAGLASAFNTPLGGITFAIEEIAKVHLSKVRTAIFQAVIFAGILSQIILGNYLYFGSIQVNVSPNSALWQSFFIAAVTGIAASLFCRLILMAVDWSKNFSYLQKVIFAACCGILLSLVFYFCGPGTMGSGKPVILGIINGQIPASIPLALGRILANLFTFVAGVAGGVFAPSLASGAALAQWITEAFSFSSPHLMIMVGMVSFLTAVTRAPLTSFILVMEMSNSHNSIVYLILAALIANGASRLILPTSMYEQMAEVFLHKARKDTAATTNKAKSDSVTP